MQEEIKGRLKKVLEKYEHSMVVAGVNADNVNYDILASERNARWKEIDNLVDQALQQERQRIVEEIEKLVPSGYDMMSGRVEEKDYNGYNQAIDDIINLISK